MSALYVDNRLVHYEVIGRRGLPVIFLHSWIGSWRYWLPTMDYVSEHHRAYALDFWGYGESDRQANALSVETYVQMLIGFLDTLGMPRTALVGHGLGGLVAVKAAVMQPERFPKIITTNTPIDGARVQIAARSSTFERLLGSSTPHSTWSKLVRRMELADRDMHRELIEDTDGLSEAVVTQTLASISTTDLRTDLRALQVPLLAIFGQRDTIVSADHAEYLDAEHPVLQQALALERSGHFPMIDQSPVFNRLVVDFLASDAADPVAVKKEWRRRVNQRDYL